MVSMIEALDNEWLAEKFVKRGVWLYLFSFIIGPLGYVIKIILSNDLSVSEIGLMYGVLSFVLLLGSFNDFWMIESLNFFIPKTLASKEYGKAKAYILFAAGIMILSSLIVAGTVVALSDFLMEHYFHSNESVFLLKTFAIFLILSNIFHFNTTVFNIYQDTKLSRWSEAIRLIITLGCVLLLHFWNLGTIESYSYTWIIGIVCILFLSSFFVWNKYLKTLFQKEKALCHKEHFKTIFSYGIWSVLTANVGIILSQVDMQLLLYLKGTEEAWYYSNYLSLIGIPFLFTGPIISFLFPVISSYFWKGDTKTIGTIHQTFTRYFALIGLIGSVCIFLFWNELWALLFSEKFRRSGEILLYSGPFLIFNLLLQINFQVFAGMGEVKKRLRVLLLWLVCNILLNIALIPHFWAEWSALAVGLSWIPLWYFSVVILWKFNSNFDFKNFLYNGSVILLFGSIFHILLDGKYWTFSKPVMILVMLAITIVFGIVFLSLNKADTKTLIHILKSR